MQLVDWNIPAVEDGRELQTVVDDERKEEETEKFCGERCVASIGICRMLFIGQFRSDFEAFNVRPPPPQLTVYACTSLIHYAWMHI